MSEQRVHELTSDGIAAAKAWLSALRGGVSFPFPEAILTSPPYAQPVEPEIYVNRRKFSTRRDAGIYFIRLLAPLGHAQVINNPYLWSWLGMFYFDEVVRKDTNGNPNLGRDTDIAYVIDPAPGPDAGRSATRRYAHRLMLAYEIYRQHGENAWFMLDEPINSLRDFTQRLVAAQELFRSKGIVPLAHTLYVNPDTRRLKPNTVNYSRANAPPGSLPRLIDVLNQLYMTYDVYGMSAEQLLPSLPSEFDRFKPIQE